MKKRPLTKYNYTKRVPELISSKTKRLILKGVIIGHVALLVLPLLGALIYEWLKPKRPKVIQVTLFSPPADTASPASQKQVAPPPPKAAPPKPKPRPKPKPTPKVKPKPRPKAKPKPKWRRAKKINISKEIVRVKPKVKRVKPTTPTKKFVPLSKEQLKKRIYKNMPTAQGVIKKSGQSSSITSSYESKVGSFLYNIWETPDKSQLGGRHPEVEIELKVATSGKVSSAKITRASGIGAMDLSVKKLLSQLTYIPTPPRGVTTLRLILEIAR